MSLVLALDVGGTKTAAGIVRGDGIFSLDMSILRNFALTERFGLQFRAEMFNATNSPMFGLPNGAFGTANFGVINSQANRPRQVQLALRLYF